MKTLRTPDERFSNLPDFPYEPRYVEVAGLRMHYVDEGPKDADPILLLHGEPSWSFLYRKMIPVFTKAGLRSVAPDLIGFGRSDKLADRKDYTYQSHMDWTTELVTKLDLKNITLFGQDWGGLIGLRMAAENTDRFARIVAANTGLSTGEQRPTEAFLKWQEFSQTAPTIEIGRLLQGSTITTLSDDVIAAYDAPFPDDSYKEGVRQFPILVPTSTNDPASKANLAAWEILRKWKKPFLTLFSDSDPVTRGGERYMQASIPGAKGQPHQTMKNAAHFLQEDVGEELAEIIIKFIKST